MIVIFKVQPFKNKATSLRNLGFFQCDTASFASRFFSSPSNFIEESSVDEGVRRKSFEVSYLINSCGLSPASALSTSKWVQFKIRDRPDSVLDFLRDHGFTHKHFSKLVRFNPALVLADPQKTLLPRFQFLYSKGFTSPELVKIFYSTPRLLNSSLQKHFIPCYEFLRTIFQPDEKLNSAVRRHPHLIGDGLRCSPKVEVLRELGMPEPFFPLLMSCYVAMFHRSDKKFKETVENVIAMGFNPKKLAFGMAMHVLLSMSPSTFDRKKGVYERWGLPRDEVDSIFMKHPLCMALSEKKITKTMDFLVNQMGLPASVVALDPIVLCFSLEKRVIPRCSVFRVLSAKGLVKKDMTFRSFLGLVEEKFLDRFVTKYQQEVPQLLSVYRGKMGELEV